MKKLLLSVLKSYLSILSYIHPKLASKKAQTIFFTPQKYKRKSWEISAIVKAKNITLENGLSCLVWGNDEGKPILMLHGWEGRASQMAVFLPLLEKKYKLIAIDAQAHGASTGTRSHPGKFVEAIEVAQRHFGSFYAVIGHSMGGGCAVYTTLEKLNVEKTVSISGPSNFEYVVRSFAQFIGLKGRALPIFMSEVEAEVALPFSQLDLASRASDITNPLLIIHDEHDLEIPFSEARKYQESVNNSEFFITQNLGHRKIMQSNVVQQKVADFLNEDNTSCSAATQAR